MDGNPLQPTLTLPTPDSAVTPAPLLLVDGHNLLWGATFGFPAPIYSRDRTRLLTGLFAFFALLRVAIRDDVPGAHSDDAELWAGGTLALHAQAGAAVTTALPRTNEIRDQEATADHRRRCQSLVVSAMWPLSSALD